jgi:hypothetical protein
MPLHILPCRVEPLPTEMKRLFFGSTGHKRTPRRVQRELVDYTVRGTRV